MSWQIWSQGKNTLSSSLPRRAGTRASLHVWRHPQVGDPEIPQALCWLWVAELCISWLVWNVMPRGETCSFLSSRSPLHHTEMAASLSLLKVDFSSCQSAEPSSLIKKCWLLSISDWENAKHQDLCLTCLLLIFLEWCAPWNPLNSLVLFFNLMTILLFIALKMPGMLGVIVWTSSLECFFITGLLFSSRWPRRVALVSQACLSTLLTFLTGDKKGFLALPGWSRVPSSDASLLSNLPSYHISLGTELKRESGGKWFFLYEKWHIQF